MLSFGWVDISKCSLWATAIDPPMQILFFLRGFTAAADNSRIISSSFLLRFVSEKDCNARPDEKNKIKHDTSWDESTHRRWQMNNISKWISPKQKSRASFLLNTLRWCEILVASWRKCHQLVFWSPMGTTGGSVAKCSSACCPGLLGIHRSGHLLLTSINYANRLRYLLRILNTILKLSVQGKEPLSLLVFVIFKKDYLLLRSTYFNPDTHVTATKDISVLQISAAFWLTVNLARLMGLSLIQWIYFMCPPCSEPIENIWKREVHYKNKLGRWTFQQSVYHIKNQTSQIFSWPAAQAQDLLLVQGATSHLLHSPVVCFNAEVSSAGILISHGPRQRTEPVRSKVKTSFILRKAFGVILLLFF